jgi:hypothetical protein
LGHLITYKYSSTYRYKNMAATNDPNEVAEALNRVAEDMRRFGYVTDETARKLEDAKTGIANFAKKADQAADLTIKSFTSVAGAGLEAAKAMHDGAKGNQAFNSSLDKMREGVEATGALLTAIIPGGPVIKALIAGLTLATGKLFDLQKVAGKMSDDLFKGFQGLSKSGAAAADGMTGLQAGMRKLGLGVQDMEGYVRLIGESSKDLALFKGSVFEGRKAFEDIGQGMQQYNYQLRAAGLTQEEINAGTMSYLRLQTRLGQSQTQSTQQLADGAKKYLIEQDALTKLTGQSREEREKEREAALSEQRFRARVEEVRATKGEEAAQRLIDANDLISSRSKEAGQAFRDLSTGMVTTEASQKGLISTNGELMRVAQALADGTMSAAEATQITGRALGKNAKDLNMLAQTGAFEDSFINFAQSTEMGTFAQENLVEALAKIREQQKKQGIEGGKAQDGLTDANIRLAKAQQKAMIDLQETTGKMMLDATNASIALADAGGKMDKVYEELVPLMNEFSKLIGQLVTVALPPLITALTALAKGLTFLLGLGPDQRSAATKAEDKAFENATTMQSIGIGMTDAQAAARQARVQEQQAKIDKDNEGAGKRFSQQNDQILKFLGFRAEGGPVNANTPYIVGEKGPELFMPKNAGDIISTKQLLGSGQPTGMPEVNAEYQKITKAIKDITKDITDRRDLEDKYTDHNKKYIDGMISLMDQDYNNTVTYMEAGGTPAAMSSGMGLQPGGGMGMTASGSLSGLKIKKGDVHAEGSALSPKLVQLAQAIQSNMPNFNYFSSFNDKFHQEKASSSSHTRGTALDFTLTKPPTPEEGQEIVSYLKSMGANLVIDEYNNPSSNATAGHIHAQIPGFADGGVAMDPTIAMVAEKGPEAMLPLTSDGFLGKLGSAMAAMVPQQQTMIGLLEDIRRSQAATATASERMAAVASN